MRCRPLILFAAALALGCNGEPPPATESAAAPTDPAAVPPARVKLAVVVVFDQLRGDYLERWGPLFGPNGFNRLTNEGAWFADCHYPYATTTTGPGHASILSGCSPDKHGIINNNWFDRKEGLEVYCAGSLRYTDVPATPPLEKDAADAAAAPGQKKPKAAGTPDRLLAPTVADVLKEKTAGRGKVIGLSLKDRGAILPAGKQPDGAYWFDDRFGTSTYYTDVLPKWVAELNRSKLADRWFDKPWERFRAGVDYDRYAGPDDGPGEPPGPYPKPGPIFPHPLDSGLSEPGPKYYAALERSPFGNDLLLAAAKAAIEAEQLGADDVPDLLEVSFSSNDLVGHAWGPDSHEVLDVTLRSDALMADFLSYLDAKVGVGNYAVVLTADHGVCPNPEVSAKAGRDAKRVPFTPLLTVADAAIREKFGTEVSGPSEPEKKNSKPVWLDAAVLPHIYLKHKLLEAKGIDPAAMADVLAASLRGQPAVYRAYTRAEILSGTGDDPLLRMVRKAYHADRGGDVYVVGQPYSLYGSDKEDASGTTHGSPHEYDTHVPLLAYGPGIPGGRRTEPVTPQHAAPIASTLLGLPVPRLCEYAVPATLTDGK